MKLKLAVVTLWAEDVEKMTDFYQNVLGLPLLNVDRGRAHFDFGGGYLVILPGQPHKPQEAEPVRFPVLAFEVEDLHEAIDRLESHGIDLPWGIEADSDARWVMFHDPGGNLIEIAMFRHQEHKV